MKLHRPDRIRCMRADQCLRKSFGQPCLSGARSALKHEVLFVAPMIQDLLQALGRMELPALMMSATE